MEKVWKKYNSFEEADRAEDEYYSSLSPDQRVAILLELVARYGKLFGGTSAGFERIFRVARLEVGFRGPPFVADEFLKIGQTFQLGRPPTVSTF